MKNINNPPIQRRNKAVDPNVLASQLAEMTQKTTHYVNVHDFEVVENDGNDYTVQMQNAIDYAITNGMILVSNPGTVNISGSGLVIWHALRWISPRGKVFSNNPFLLNYTGAGTAITVRAKNTASGAFTDSGAGEAQVGAVFLDNINIQRHYSDDSTYATGGFGNAGYGIDFYQTSEIRLESCEFTGFRVGIHAQGLSIAEFVKCDIKMNMYGAWLKTGAENGSRTHNNVKLAFHDCNFYNNNEATVVPGYYQNLFFNCHMEQTKRFFYFPMDANHHAIDTFTVIQGNHNSGASGDAYYTGPIANGTNAKFIDIQFADATGVYQLHTIMVQNSRIHIDGTSANVINATTLNNPNSSIEITWFNNNTLGLGDDGTGHPTGLIHSDSVNQPMVLVSGRNTYGKYDTTSYPSGSNFYGTNVKVVGFEANQSSLNAVGTLTGSVLNFSTIQLGSTDITTKYIGRPLQGTNVSGNTPSYLGQVYIDTNLKVSYMAVGLTSADWKQITN